MSTTNLPTDLERTIFEITALSVPESIPKLVLVAWRVKNWLEPLLYRTLVFPPNHSNLVPAFLETLSSKPAPFFANSTRHLFMHLLDPPTMHTILSACSQVENLWLSSPSAAIHSLVPLLSTLPNLKHLYINLFDLFIDTPVDFTHPMFSRLTHLELIGFHQFSFENDMTLWLGLARLPCLTHLAFSDTSFIILCLHSILEASASLRIAVALLEEAGEYPESLRKDFRLVLTTCKLFRQDWKRGVGGGKDYWLRAEEFVASRRAVGDTRRIGCQIGRRVANVLYPSLLAAACSPQSTVVRFDFLIRSAWSGTTPSITKPVPKVYLHLYYSALTPRAIRPTFSSQLARSRMAISPTLPPELERAIFDLTACSWPRSIPRLMLVAWRVKTWVEPLLYQILIVGSQESFHNTADKDTHSTQPPFIASDMLLSLVNSKQSTFFRDSVRNLCLLDSPRGEDILSACCGVENLWIWAFTTIPIADLHFTRPLKRLHGAVVNIFGTSKIDFTRSPFLSMTHLEMFDEVKYQGWEIWSALTHLPHLTHLAFNDPEHLWLCAEFLPTLETLRVLVILFQARENADVAAEVLDDYDVPELADEPRVVFLACFHYLDDWITGARMGCGDYWSRAETHVAKRKSGEIRVREYYIPDNRDDV